jgi:hypothetical protein
MVLVPYRPAWTWPNPVLWLVIAVERLAPVAGVHCGRTVERGAPAASVAVLRCAVLLAHRAEEVRVNPASDGINVSEGASPA